MEYSLTFLYYEKFQSSIQVLILILMEYSLTIPGTVDFPVTKES